MQGQFTQDLRLPDGAAAYGLWLDQKGKVLADSQVLKVTDNHYLIASFGVTSRQLRSRLETYLIADEVEVQDETAKWVGWLLWGEGAANLRPPDDGLSWPSRRAGQGSVQWLIPEPRSGAVEIELKKMSATASDQAAAELVRLRSGLPAVPGDIGPRDLPNEGGLEVDAISFTKGCYLGQEVMARLKNLGRVRRRLHLVKGAGEPPAPGTALYQGARKVGETRSAAADGRNFLAMAMMSETNLDPSTGVSRIAGSAPDLGILRRV